MTAETPRGDDRAVLAEAVEGGLRRCRVEDAPSPLIRENDLHHVTHMVTQAVAAAGFTRAPQAARNYAEQRALLDNSLRDIPPFTRAPQDARAAQVRALRDAAEECREVVRYPPSEVAPPTAEGWIAVGEAFARLCERRADALAASPVAQGERGQG